MTGVPPAVQGGPISLDGKVVIIAGGSGGLGRTVVPAFLGMRARVVTADRNPDPARMKQHAAMKAGGALEANA